MCDWVVYKNDGWESGQNAAFQGGFIAGEQAGATLGPFPDPVKLSWVYFLFGPSDSGVWDITLNIYTDTGDATPGALLHTGTYSVLAASSFMSAIDLRSENIVVSSDIRVSIKFSHDGPPSVARDDDGNFQNGKNWLYGDIGSGPAWYNANTLVSGDWIIRAIVEPQSP